MPDAVMKLLAGGAEAAFVALVVGWFLVGWARGRGSDRRGAVAALLAALVALGINQVLGHLWVRPRPFAAHAGVHVLLSRSADSSFPSDHAAAAFAIAVVAVMVRPRLGVALVVVAALVAYARVYVGAHYPGDVSVGALVGTAVALVLMRPLAVVPQRLTDFGDALLGRLHLAPREGARPAA
ncbi:MAG: undecaprenyl-diphosphatase [Candidatus Dormibacteria bacterium]